MARDMFVLEIDKSEILSVGWKALALMALVVWTLMRSEQPVYLIDFACFEPPRSWRITQEDTLECLRAQDAYTDESMAFQKRLMDQSGVGEETAWPPGVIKSLGRTWGSVKIARNLRVP